MLSVCIVAFLGWQLSVGQGAIASDRVLPTAQPALTGSLSTVSLPALLASTDVSSPDQGQPSQPDPETTPQPSAPTVKPTPAQRQQVTYPEPPDVYDYDTLRQYDEEVYGEKDSPPVTPSED
jgi:hypothetical protein